MAATEGTAIFLGLQTGQTYVCDLYLDDVAGAAVNWDQGVGASATTREHISFPEPVSLQDVAVVTGAAQTKLQLAVDGVAAGPMLRQTMHLNTLALRPRLNIGIAPRAEVSMLQLA